MEKEILVSVYCLVYNHEKYLRDALEGFVSQKVNFRYEVFVHDDASQDGSKDIILEYAKKYPDIIIPIIQTENQYSKGVRMITKFIYPRMRGKYIAICEGDDYWCDENKLQRQVEFMEAHPDYSACVHNTMQLNCVTNQKTLINIRDKECDLGINDILQGGNSQYQISSLLYRIEYFNRPEAFHAKGFGDYPMAIHLALNGKIHYYPEVMSVYRLFAQGSWTQKNHLSQDQSKKQIEHLMEVNRMLRAIDEYCKYTHTDVIKAVIRKNSYKISIEKREWKEIFGGYRDIFMSESAKTKIIVILKVFFPKVYLSINHMKSKRAHE